MQAIGYGIPRRMASAVASMMRRPDLRHYAARAESTIEAIMADTDRIPLTAGEGAIFAAADRLAHECFRVVVNHDHFKNPLAIRLQIDAVCKRMGILYPLGETDGEAWARACDRQWWVRALRKEFARRFENSAIRLGMVGARIDPYITRESGARQAKRNEENRKALEQAEIVCTSDGPNKDKVLTLAQAADAGMANKANRRNELMTRIRGFQEIAEALNHRALFATITAPSKYHSVGGENARYAERTPREAQAYLCKVWARIRAAMKRAGIVAYGFRVAEPHTDGCPHWHMLLFVSPAKLEKLQAIITRYALAEDGDEPGAQEQRVKLVMMDASKGTAAGYIAKYIAKNIDGLTADGASMGVHRAYGDAGEGQTSGYLSEQIKTTRHDGRDLTPAERVCYWSQLHGIRQFQQIGGAPVGVWRELRRVEEGAIVDAPAVVRDAWEAVQKTDTGEKDANGKPIFIQADWKRYVMAQGGPECGRHAVIQLWKKEVTVEGRYGRYEAEKPCGIWAVSAGAKFEAASVRYEWRRVDPSQGFDLPWTGVNNCTAPGKNAAWTKAKNQNFGSAKLMPHQVEAVMRPDIDYSGTQVRPMGPKQIPAYEKFKQYRAAQWGGVSVHLMELKRKYSDV